jgi:CBS-domain-containing membrane protein
MTEGLNSLEPGGTQRARKHLTWRDEFVLALLPTATVLVVFLMVESFASQRFLFASLAASAFLIYLDPEHGTNRIRTLIIAQLLAAVLGLLTYVSFGPGYLSGAVAMVITIVLMILLDALHPPAVSTSLIFAFRAGDETNLFIFALAVAMTAVLVFLERSALWLLARDKGVHLK